MTVPEAAVAVLYLILIAACLIGAITAAVGIFAAFTADSKPVSQRLIVGVSSYALAVAIVWIVTNMPWPFL